MKAFTVRRLLVLAALLLLPALLSAQTTVPNAYRNGVVAGPVTLDGLDQTAVIELYGHAYVGISVSGSDTANMTVWTEFSADGGVTWDERVLRNGDECVTGDDLPHTVEAIRNYTVFTLPADTHARLRVQAYTSGAVSVVLRASSVAPIAAFDTMCPSLQVNKLFDGTDTLEIVTNHTQSTGFFLQDSTLDATLTIEGSPDTHDQTLGWFTLPFYAAGTWRATWAVTASTTGSILTPFNYPHYQRYRLRVSTYNSGAARIKAHGSPATGTDWVMSLLNQPNTITEVASGTADADAAIAAGAFLRLCGIAIKENAGTPAAAEVSLVHGATVGGGTQIGGLHFDLAANEEVVQWFSPNCIAVASGISVDRVAGTTKLTLFHKTVP